MDKKKPFKKIKAHTFRGKRYSIIWKKPPKHFFGHDADGACDDRESVNKEIWINPNLTEEEFLKTCIDEAFHACLFEVDNDIVDQISEDMGTFLYRIGFRLDKNKKV